MKIFEKLLILFCAAFLLQSCVVSEKPNMAFFKEPGNEFQDTKFISVNVPAFLAKPYIKKALKEDDTDKEIINLVKKVSKIKVLVVENGNVAVLKKHTAYLNNNYDEWATIKHNGDQVNVRVKQKGNKIKNMFITVNSDKDLVFVDVKGNFTTNDISKMINSASKN